MCDIIVSHSALEYHFLSVFEPLSDREKQVMVYTIIYGLSRREAGQMLGISPNTVRNHLSKIQEKLSPNDYESLQGVSELTAHLLAPLKQLDIISDIIDE